MHFLVATAQGLNPTLSNLCEVLVTSITIMNDKFAVHRKAFLKYQLEELSTKEEVTPPSERNVGDPSPAKFPVADCQGNDDEGH